MLILPVLMLKLCRLLLLRIVLYKFIFQVLVAQSKIFTMVTFVTKVKNI